MFYEGYRPHCGICKQQVNLTESKADECGQAVHEDCYVSKLLSEKVYARAGYNHSLRIQTGQRTPIPLLCCEDHVYRVGPIPHPSLGGFWY